MTECSTNDLATDGTHLFKGALKPCMKGLKAALADLPPDEAGVRIHGIEALKPLLASTGWTGAVAASTLGEDASQFERSFSTNRRKRVLQVDFAAEALPNGLEWLGV